MKQNLEVMSQIYKNLYALFDDSWKNTHLGNNYVAMEIFIEKEVIKFIIAVPLDYLETLEKAIGSFYPGAVVEPIEQPKLLETGKYMD
ncbi:TPA: hypothetical protein DIC40_08635 [Patescibacteria group bacterium]|nr:hypothetical protein [Candidatus Gracilibacteria bacterium]